MNKVAFLLSGCGHLDGSEIHEASMSLLSLSMFEFDVKCFATNTEFQPKNHITNKDEGEKRNVLTESARIARGEIYDIKTLNVEEFDILFIPGGLGTMNNFNNFLKSGGQDLTFHAHVAECIQNFYSQKKYICSVCIAPLTVALALQNIEKQHKLEITIGDDEDNSVTKTNAINKVCSSSEFHYDQYNKIFSTPAYMSSDDMTEIFEGISTMVEHLYETLEGVDNA